MTAPPTLDFAFDWRPDEHARVIRRVVRDRLSTLPLRALRWGVYAFLLVAAVVAWAGARGGDTTGALALAILIAITAGLLVGFPRLVAALRVRQTRRHDPNVSHSIRYTFDRTGVMIGSRTADTTLRWDGLHAVREDGEFLLFYYSRWMPYYLPKRVVGTEIEVLRSVIRDRLPEDVPFEER